MTKGDASPCLSSGRLFCAGLPLKHWNLEPIISVGYRVNPKRGVCFWPWATHSPGEHNVLVRTVMPGQSLGRLAQWR